ncbi:MAG: hypothetical protein JW786_14220 [Desulfobacterales bacterium]|nr:hypothetical protein [Desulfobacterales bacterium]
MKNPIQAFLEWYRSLALGQRQYLAHMYIVLTTRNTADFVLAREASPERFERHVVKQDFPVRMVAKMMAVRAIIDFIFINRELLHRKIPGAPFVADIAEKQWRKGLESWKILRSMELSDFYTNLWLKSELMTENGFDK